MKITARSVAALTLPRGKSDVIHFDDDLPGFGYRLRLGARGKVNASWVAQYRRAGATRRVLLGNGAVLSVEQARTAAKKILAKVALGEDPQADKAERRDKDRLSLRSVVDEYLAVKQSEVRPGTLREITRYLVGPYFRVLHGMAVDSITRRDVASAVVAAQRQHSAAVATLARATLSSFFAWALTMGIVESNPVIGAAQPKAAEPRSRVLSDAELVRIWNACGDDDYGKIIRLLILLPCRRQEVGGAAWSEFDFERGIWTIPAARSKNGKAHTLPLMPVALEILENVPRMATRDHLFGARSLVGFGSWGEGKSRLDARSGVQAYKVHDVRRSVATKMADIGVAPHVIEQILNHQSGHKAGPAGIYNRSSYEREVRNALALWADHVRSLVAGGERKVLPFSPPPAS
jgi:integrase